MRNDIRHLVDFTALLHRLVMVDFIVLLHRHAMVDSVADRLRMICIASAVDLHRMRITVMVGMATFGMMHTVIRITHLRRLCRLRRRLLRQQL